MSSSLLPKSKLWLLHIRKLNFVGHFASVGRGGRGRIGIHGWPDRRKGFVDEEKGRQGKREVAREKERFSTEGVTGTIVEVLTNG